MIDIFAPTRAEKEIEKELISAIQSVMETGRYCRNFELLGEFENAFAKYCKKTYAIGVNSGSDALFFALLAHGVGKGDEVITVSHSFMESSASISKVGATPVFVDIDTETFNMNVKEIESKINNKTKAILPVHIYGQSVEMDKILDIANKYKLVVIEDCCQAHGAAYSGVKVPIGTTGCFSFYPTKNLGALGDAGIVVTDNEKVAAKIKSLRDDGRSAEAGYLHDEIGYNSRMDGIQAAALITKMPYLNKWNEERKKIAKRYDENLKDIVKIPKVGNCNEHVYYLYVIKVQNRETLMNFLKENGVGTAIHYPLPIHQQPPYKHLGYEGKLPVTEKIVKEILSLPIYPGLTIKEVDEVCEKIKDFYSK
ncbi:MAG: DegT/DnrJ/EryC1/StrS family aminotransferase [Candidatus Pacearchaeota archaeon]|nr:DegT/DnrJ/EryC1/StrS family aminotransferase [Candidatus Pacearchaeota archaeon]